MHINPCFQIPTILIPLWRRTQIFHSISSLLYGWFSDDLDTISSHQSDDAIWPPYPPDTQLSFNCEMNGEELVNVILSKPSMIPLETNPSSTFFLSSAENFCEAYEHWLRFSLVLHGVKASYILSNQYKILNIIRLIKGLLRVMQ